MATHPSILSWRIPRTEGSWRASAHSVANSWTGLKWRSTHWKEESFLIVSYEISGVISIGLDRITRFLVQSLISLAWFLCLRLLLQLGSESAPLGKQNWQWGWCGFAEWSDVSITREGCWARSTQNLLQCKRRGFHPWVRKIPWGRAWQPTPAFLPGESHGQRSLVGYSPWHCTESDTEATQHAYLHPY